MKIATAVILVTNLISCTLRGIYDTRMSKITVVLVNYRDILCGSTIRNLYYRAMNPTRIFVNITQETFSDDDDCYWDVYNSVMAQEDLKFKLWLDNNLSIIRKNAAHSMGLHINVYQAQLLLPDDSGFALKIDPHSDFQPDFDHDMIKLFNDVGDENAILGNHAMHFYFRAEFLGVKNPDLVCTSCALYFWDSNIFLLRYFEFINTKDFACFANPGACRSSLLVASNIFGRTHFMKNVPYDPYMSYLFLEKSPCTQYDSTHMATICIYRSTILSFILCNQIKDFEKSLKSQEILIRKYLIKR